MTIRLINIEAPTVNVCSISAKTPLTALVTVVELKGALPNRRAGGVRHAPQPRPMDRLSRRASVQLDRGHAFSPDSGGNTALERQYNPALLTPNGDTNGHRETRGQLSGSGRRQRQTNKQNCQSMSPKETQGSTGLQNAKTWQRYVKDTESMAAMSTGGPRRYGSAGWRYKEDASVPATQQKTKQHCLEDLKT